MPALLSIRLPKYCQSYIFGEDEVDFLGFKKLPLLEQQVEVWLFQNPYQLVLADWVQVNLDRKSAQKFRNQIFDLCHGERATGNEKNVVCLDVSEFGADCRSLDQR